MTSSLLGRGLGLVLVEYEYEYPGRDGELVSIKPNERYVLLAKTNDHWWQVHRDHSTKPFYIPAKYVKELPLDFPSPLDLTEPTGPDPVLLTVAAPVPGPAPKTLEYNEECSSARTKPGDEVTIRLRTDSSCRKTENRMSTFGVPLDFHDLSPVVAPAQQRSSAETSTSVTAGATASSDGALSRKRPSLTGFQGKPLALDDQRDSGKPRVPSFSPADPLAMPRAHTQPIPVETPVVPVIPSTNNLHNSTSASLGHQDNESPIASDEEEEEEEQGESSSENKEELLHKEDSNHIYESIQDLNLDLDALVAGRRSPSVAPDPSPAPPPAEDVRSLAPDLPVYANVSSTKKPSLPPISVSDPSLPCPSAPDSALSSSSHTPSSSVSSSGVLSPVSLQDGWQVHTDQETGKVFYYHPVTGQSTWCDPRSPPPQLSPASSQGSHGWEQLVDEASGKLYYYNPSSGVTSWAVPEPLCPSDSATRRQTDGPPPLPEEDYPIDDIHNAVFTQHAQQGLSVIPRAHMDLSPPGSSSSTDTEGKIATAQPPQHRLRSEEDRGKPYYNLKGGRLEFSTSLQTLLGNGVEEDGGPLQVRNCRHSVAEDRFNPSHRRNLSDLSEPSSRGHSPERPQGHLLEKAGILNKTKVVDSGKRIRKNWAQSWTVLHGGILTFHKDPKSAPTGNASKTSQIVPDYNVELRGALISWAPKDKSSKKNVLELKTRHGCEYLMQYDTESIICDWYKAILDSIRQLEQEHLSEEEEDEASDKEDKDRKRTSWSGAADSEHSRVRTKLRRFLQRRPTLQSVKEKGYIRDNVFGCYLDTLCHRENTTVPKFVEKCIRTVERRGLDVDGIYRVSGNLAVIQKLRHRADHEEQLDLEDGQWEEIHVITGALKLFLRELPEPLFPFSCFDKFIAAIQVPDYSQRVSYMKDLVQTLPLPHHNTMELLFTHLRRVIDHGESNRMSAQSIAIVFGPTLLRPQTESANMTINMVFQSQIVELMLKEFQSIFSQK